MLDQVLKQLLIIASDETLAKMGHFGLRHVLGVEITENKLIIHKSWRHPWRAVILGISPAVFLSMNICTGVVNNEDSLTLEYLESDDDPRANF